MQQKLTERYVIDLMKEEWDKKVHSLLEKKKKSKSDASGGLKVDFDVDGDGYKENVISPGLKVVDITDGPMKGQLYDVVSVDKDTVTLGRADAAGKEKLQFTITRQEFEAKYDHKRKR